LSISALVTAVNGASIDAPVVRPATRSCEGKTRRIQRITSAATASSNAGTANAAAAPS
jgi:hypothetical protein